MRKDAIDHLYLIHTFLLPHIKVQKVIHYNGASLTLSKLKGIQSHYIIDRRHTVASEIGYYLKRLHDIPIDDCTLYSTHELRRFHHRPPIPHFNQDDVFIHGSPSLEHIIILNDRFGGFINLQSAGIGHRYVDLAICFWSILHHFNDLKCVEAFFDEYGVEYFDYQKLYYYLDMLHLKMPA